jgi:hypothetical protein
MRIRARTFEDWMRANFSKSDLQDMTTHGVDSGFGGLTYYSDTIKLYDRFADEIWNALWEDAQCAGYNNVLQFITDNFRCSDVSCDAEFKNLLVWYMAERTANELLEGRG